MQECRDGYYVTESSVQIWLTDVLATVELNLSSIWQDLLDEVMSVTPNV